MTFSIDRARMVAEDLMRRGIRDARVLDVMGRLPREAFVPEAHQDYAYADQALPIGEGQSISQPYIVAAMTEALGLTGGERVLEVGTGSGYQAAILAELTREVISIERHPELAATARARLASLGYHNVSVVVGDGSVGYAAAAPYDAILVTAGAPDVPAPLKAQLADGGRLVIPVGSRGHQDLFVIRREHDVLTTAIREGCVFVPLVGANGWAPS
jgi:protein-L-isoaspartate(D-aspartate) O-methyltransferase